MRGNAACCYTSCMDIFAFLDAHGIAYDRFNHPAVFTCEESTRLAPPMPGLHTKNLFLRDEKGKRRILVVVSTEKRVDLKALRTIVQASKLSFGSPELLRASLGVEPGSVTILGLMHDTDHQVEVIIDEEVWRAEAIGCHPLVNTATLVIPHAGLERFLQVTGHTHRVIAVPERATM